MQEQKIGIPSKRKKHLLEQDLEEPCKSLDSASKRTCQIQETKDQPLEHIRSEASASHTKHENEGGLDAIPVKMERAQNVDVSVKLLKNEVVLAARMGGENELAKASVSKKKILKRTEIDFEPINRWWEKIHEGMSSNEQWSYLEHNGIMFSPSYVAHNVPVIYNGRPMILPIEAEEVANYWCGVLGTELADNVKFIKNFWNAFLEKFPEDHIVWRDKKFEYFDFTLIKEHLDAEKEKKKQLSKDEKEELKRQKQEAEAPYAYALVDWLREKLGNSKVEPPGLFRGRGDHPKQGQLKARIFPENVTLNCAEDAPVPRIGEDMAGHCWNDVYHDNTVTWLAFYKDSINDQYKYMYLAAQSKFKGMQDFLKYEKARELKGHVERVRDIYSQKMLSSDMMDRQLGTATYLIDFLALRVGGEKDTDEEADTVGCCSLRLEHVTFNNQTEEITLDFLGKDSIRYFNTVKINHQAFKNMVAFCKGKKPDENIFNKISSVSLNSFLKELMNGLTAKVFRTYNASITLQQQLSKIRAKNIDVNNPHEILQFYNDANREVAILCNHQRSIPKQHEASMGKLNKQNELLLEDIRECQEYLVHLRSGKTTKFKFKSNVCDFDNIPRKAVTRDGMKEEACRNKIHQFLKRKSTLDYKIRAKDGNKTVSLGTSKINYMDPRITVAFCKSYEMNIEKVFNRSLRLKFPWAMFATMNFDF